MRRIIGVGETVLDILFKGDKPVSALPGGSVLNTLVSLSRCGISCSLVTELGEDRVGKQIKDFLVANQVDVSNVRTVTDSNTSLALAFLTPDDRVEYEFYKSPYAEQIEWGLPEITSRDIILVGSFYALSPRTRLRVERILREAKAQNAIIYYDVNYRAEHRNDIMKIRPNLLDNFELADIVRGSTEDFDVLYGCTEATQIFKSEISFYCNNFICTAAQKQTSVCTREATHTYDIPEVEVVSTVGAGDNFNAGMLYGLILEDIYKENIAQGLSTEQWERLMRQAILFATSSCTQIHNYISKDLGKKMQQQLRTLPTT